MPTDLYNKRNEQRRQLIDIELTLRRFFLSIVLLLWILSNNISQHPSSVILQWVIGILALLSSFMFVIERILDLIGSQSLVADLAQVIYKKQLTKKQT